MQKLAKPQQHVLHEILTPLSQKIIFIRAIFLILSAFQAALGPTSFRVLWLFYAIYGDHMGTQVDVNR